MKGANLDRFRKKKESDLNLLIEVGKALKAPLYIYRKESWARCSSLRKELFASRLYYSPLPCQVLEGRHFLQVLGGHGWKALKDGRNSGKRKRKGGALYLLPTSLGLSFSLPSTANPDRGLGLSPPPRKRDPHERAESNRAATDNKATLNQ